MSGGGGIEYKYIFVFPEIYSQLALYEYKQYGEDIAIEELLKEISTKTEIPLEYLAFQ